MNWQPIETAPKDSSWILLTGGKIDYGWDGDEPPSIVVGQHEHVHHHKGDRWQFAWYESGYYGQYESPTHWMLLPKLPEVA